MGTSCLFGIFVFASDYSLIYRFLTDDLFTYLYKVFQEKYGLDGNNDDTEDIPFSIDDTITQHFSTLLHFYSNTFSRGSPIKRITLESKVQVFFDQIGENKVLCMAEESFHTLVILKAINLFKSLIRFHIGSLSFAKSSAVNKSIDRISASLQYYLNNITTNQSLLFESSEYLHINFSIRQKCVDACTTINQTIKISPTIILITCKDKIVHIQSSNEQNRLSNSDIFLLLLNSTSRSLRTEFKVHGNNLSHAMAHIYKTRNDYNINQNLTNSEINLTDDIQIAQARRAQSLPTIPVVQSTEVNDDLCIEIIFMKTSSKTLAPFTMYTIGLTNDISVIILVEWKTSSACSILSELIGKLYSCINQSQISYTKLNDQVKFAENNATIRRYFENEKRPSNTLSSILNKTHAIYKTLPKRTEPTEEDRQRIDDIMTNLTTMNDISIDIFHKLFFNSNIQVNLTNSSTNDNNLLKSSTIQSLKTELLRQLGDMFSFIETKSQGNITISFCQHAFPGLVHFALIDRSRGRIYTPVLFTEEYKHYLTKHSNNIQTEYIKEKKIIDFEFECLSALQRGCTSYTLTDEYFTYNYTLRLQESNGASMRLYKPFVKSEPPGILHYNFYQKLAYENYGSLGDHTLIDCYELICVHLRFVPPNIVREHCEQLWPKLIELAE